MELTSLRRRDLTSKSKIPPKCLLACEQILKGISDEVELFGFHATDYKVKRPLGIRPARFVQGLNHELHPRLTAESIRYQAVSQMRSCR